MDDLVVNNELTATVVDNKSTNATTALGVSVTNATVEVTLRDNSETLANVAGVSHGDDCAVVTQVQDAVGLVDGAQHGLDDDGRRRVGDEAGLLLQLAAEEVDTEVAVLAGLGGDGDTDDLAGTALQDQDVADAHEVARDGDGFAGGDAAATGLNDTDILTGAADASWAMVVSNQRVTTRRMTDDGLRQLRFRRVMVMVKMMEGMDDAVGSTLDTAAEGVVVTVVVVVTHFLRELRLVDLKSGSGRSRRRRSDGLTRRCGRLRGSRRRENGSARGLSARRGVVGLVERGDFLGGRTVVGEVGGLRSLERGLYSRGRRSVVGVGLGTTAVLFLGEIELVLEGRSRSI